MDRMIAGLLVLGLFLTSTSRVLADEWNYVPAYAASPSASATPAPDMGAVPTVTGQPKITCTLKTILPSSMRAPVEASFAVSGTIDGDAVSVFRYLFGDGESATGSGQMKHVYTSGGTYQVRVTPVVIGDVEVPICKTKIVVNTGETAVDPVVESTPSAAVATTSATVTVQPKTGPSGWYWASLGVLLVVWLGAVTWYQNQRPQIG